MEQLKSTIDLKRSEKFQAAFARAQMRAGGTQAPHRFMNTFEEEVNHILVLGEGSLLERSPTWEDPLHLAAEVEALAAVRAVRHWGTEEGLCPIRGHR